jgi:hypothetical protein
VQSRAQARTAVQLAKLHPHWRTYLATGLNPVQRGWAKFRRNDDRLRSTLGDLSEDRSLSERELRAARGLASAAYFDELEKSLANST